MRVLLNAAHVRSPSGTAVYAEHLADALRSLGVEVEIARPRPFRHSNVAAEALWHGHLRRRARAFDVLHHLLPAHTPAAGPSRGRRAPGVGPARESGVRAQVVTVHDLAFIREPECFNARYRAVAVRRHRRAVRAAAAVVVPSEATAADVRSRWRRDRIVVAPHGPGQAPRHDRGEARHFLYVGDAEPRKNLERLRAAHARSGVALPLVVAGGAGEHVDAEGLADLHRHAAALVLPSLHEGFGLPALEAMHAGTPVIAARTAGLAELCADAARFVDPRDVDSMAAALTEVATVPPLREELRRRGLARAAAYSWERSARAHLDAYTLALG